ncbi:MAG: DUF2852 domain-containing protein [Rhizobiales bacterium]|nr:DUF2852 domain-containing protein [Hyphomicrobiales bacterium]
MKLDDETVEPNNWRTSNIGILIIAILVIMPFGLVLLAMLTFGKNIDLPKMFKDFWNRLRNGAEFDQPALWGNGSTKYNHPNQAYNEYRREDDAAFDADQAQKRAELIKQELAFNAHLRKQKMAEDNAEFKGFKNR